MSLICLSLPILCVTARLEKTEEKLSVYTICGFLAEIIHTTQCLLDFINAFEKWDLFILGVLVEDGKTSAHLSLTL
jgi:hypothetical protein